VNAFSEVLSQNSPGKITTTQQE